MNKAKAVSASDTSRKMRPALTPEARENQMISLAVGLAEQQLIQGTASSQVITHFLKLGSTRAQIEKEMLTEQKQLVAAKTESIKAAQRIEALYGEAMDAMRSYSGQGEPNDDY